SDSSGGESHCRQFLSHGLQRACRRIDREQRDGTRSKAHLVWLLAGEVINVEPFGEGATRDFIEQQDAGRVMAPALVEVDGVEEARMMIAESDQRRDDFGPSFE